MNAIDLLNDVTPRVPHGAPIGTRARVEARVPTARGARVAAVDVRIDFRGRRREQFFFEGRRVPPPMWLRLCCAEGGCDHVRAAWSAWDGAMRPGAAAPRPTRPIGLQPRPLMDECRVRVAGLDCVARPAVFRSFVACPNAAHPPTWLDQHGYDLFEDEVWLAGGLQQGGDRPEPRLRDLVAVTAYLESRRLEAQLIVQRLAGAPR